MNYESVNSMTVNALFHRFHMYVSQAKLPHQLKNSPNMRWNTENNIDPS